MAKVASETSTSTSMTTSTSTSGRSLPGWVLGWFYATAAICTWDASFIMLRPHSLPGGSLHHIWKPYYLYIEVDQRYGDINDPFVYGISLFNYAEVIMNIITIVLHYKNSRHTVPLAFTVTVMTFWKTLFYFYAFSDLGGGAPYREGNSPWAEFFLFVIPNGFWIVLPLYVMVVLWQRIVPAAQVQDEAETKAKAKAEASVFTARNGGHMNGHVRNGVRKHVFHAKNA